jgi:SAM-dependent methyltransferase
MDPIGAHLAFGAGLSRAERWYLRVLGPPELSLRIRTAHVLRAADRVGPRRVLDAGAGAGFTAISLALRRPDAHVTALDIDEPQVDHGRRLAEAAGVGNLTFIAGDALAYEPESPFDAVVCVDALEYVADDGAFLRRVRSWLLPDATLILHCRATPTAYRRAAFKTTPFTRDGRVRPGYSRSQLQGLLEASGFTNPVVETTLTAPAELAYELVDPEFGVFRSKGARALAAPPLLLLAQLDRLRIGRGAGLLAVARRSAHDGSELAQ